jgi:FRG domain-containing protein
MDQTARCITANRAIRVKLWSYDPHPTEPNVAFTRSLMFSLRTDVTVTSWPELQEKLYEGSWQQSLGRFRSPFAYRGASHASASVETTLSRLGPGYERREQSLLRNFRKYAHRDAVHFDSLWNWMALAQHHGLPTRLLDWTFSPYVALHFATVDPEERQEPAAIWCVDCVQVKEHLPAVLKRMLSEQDSDVLTIEMLDRAAPTLRQLERLSRKPFIAFFEPPSLDDRIVNQSALFSVSSTARGSFGEWLSAHPQIVRRVIIPAELKWEVRDKLDQANINERVLFPGLDGLSQWLTRYYSPRNSCEPIAPSSAAKTRQTAKSHSGTRHGRNRVRGLALRRSDE